MVHHHETGGTVQLTAHHCEIDHSHARMPVPGAVCSIGAVGFGMVLGL